ncbi:GH32 C-terminal domain-containing protein [Streptomyces flavidovirens]|uniref:glycoside hydrolase family 32 protein n=1 Tax=Streptomyces flavidovirens TaxID=67298 RepID=UPI0033A15B4D
MSRWRAPKLITAAALLVAALTPISANAAPRPAPRLATGPVNPGFETGDLTGWTVTEGTAFGPRSVTDAATYWGGPFHHKGQRHLWGFAAAGDEATGTLKSSSFTAPSSLSFLIAGGWDPERLYVALVRDSDGKQLLKQTGMDDEAYVRILWDTSRWRGQAVHLEVVDRKGGGGDGAWAHINLDDVRTQNAARDDNGLTFRTLGQANQPAAASHDYADYAADPLRPQFHYTPYQGWINDPNGVIQFRGRHHLFSQYYPDAPKWGPMHWAHADSPDAVRWRELPVALTPPPRATPTDNTGIFSGSAVDDNGTLTVAYTKFTDTAARPGATPETVEIATSTDGVNFTAGTEVVSQPPAGSSAGFRDPKLFRDPTDNRWKMVIGSGDGGHGKVQLYASDDLRSWTYAGVLAEGDSADGPMWECPDFFPVGDKWVLLYSADNKQFYETGTYDGKTFHSEKKGLLDAGSDFYAAQHYRDDRGRDLAVAWMSDWKAKEPTRVNGWAGAQSVHRELFLRPDGGLGSRPVAELATLATGRIAEVRDKTVSGAWRLGRGDTSRLKAVVDLKATTADTVVVRLKASGAEATELRYTKSTATLTLDTTKAGYGTTGTWSAQVPAAADGTLTLDVLTDRSSVEVFTGDGTALTARVYPRYRESDAVEFSAGGGGEVRLKSATLTRLGSSWTD